jgi:hypothetical protein
MRARSDQKHFVAASIGGNEVCSSEKRCEGRVPARPPCKTRSFLCVLERADPAHCVGVSAHTRRAPKAPRRLHGRRALPLHLQLSRSLHFSLWYHDRVYAPLPVPSLLTRAHTTRARHTHRTACLPLSVFRPTFFIIPTPLPYSLPHPRPCVAKISFPAPSRYNARLLPDGRR